MNYFVGNETYEGFENCSIQDVYDYCKNCKVLAIDIETSSKYPSSKFQKTKYKGGLDPYLSRIIMFQIGDKENRYVIDVRSVDISILLPILEDENILKVGANLIFESLHFKHNYGITIRGMYDVLLVDRILTNGLYDSYSLESLRKRYRGHVSNFSIDLFGGNMYQKEIDKIYKELIDEAALLGITIDEAYIMEEAISRVSETHVDKSIRMQFVNWGDKPFTLQQLIYGEEDINEPLLIREILMKGRKVIKSVSFDKGNVNREYEIYYPEKAIKLENKLIEPLAHQIYGGVLLEQDMWVSLAKSKEVEYYTKIQVLNDWVVDKYPEFRGTLDLFTGKPECSILWSSSKQVQKLFDKLDITVTERSKFTGKMEKTIGAKALIKFLPNEYKDKFMSGNWSDDLNDKYNLVVFYLLLKKTQQLMTTYGADFLQYVHPITGRVHCNIRQFLNTGRMAATSPNALAIPRGKEYRDCFIAPEQYKIWACDYTSQEIVVTADIYQIKSLSEFFSQKVLNPEMDMHCWVADKLYKIYYKDENWKTDKKKNKKERQNAKIASFLIIYQGGGKALGEMLGVGEEEGNAIIDTYYDAFPEMRPEFVKRKKLSYNLGWIQISRLTDKRYFYRDFDKMLELFDQAISYYPKGRKATEEEKLKIKEDYPEVKQLWKEYNILKGKLERRTINFPVQGNSAEMMKLAILYLWKEYDPECFAVLQIHDEMIGYVKSEVKHKIDNVKQKMIQAANVICPNTVMFAEMEVGDAWIH